jgi:catechol 2,3-dioxygenase-like lactoylglutathione lyase family enzyme
MTEWFARPVLHVSSVISVNVEPGTHEAEVAAVDALRAELEARGVEVKDGRWGYRLVVVEDPDGHQLYFPLAP